MCHCRHNVNYTIILILYGREKTPLSAWALDYKGGLVLDSLSALDLLSAALA